jgi:endonuclease YncB( thermonuclease family)
MADLQDRLRAIINEDTTLPGGMTAKDADTLALLDGQALRLKGVDARETAKFIPGSKIEGSQLGADTQTKLVEKTMREEGYNIPVPLAEKDVYGRQLGDVTTDTGARLTTRLLEQGFIDPYTTMDRQQETALTMGRLDRAKRKAEQQQTIGDQLLDSLNEERAYMGLQAKRMTVDAKGFGAAVDSSGKSDFFSSPMMIREGEDKQGYAKSNFDTGLDIGLAQMKQGWFGTFDLIGEKTGNEFLKSYGQRNVRSLQSELENLPYLRNAEAIDEQGNWKIDSLGKMIDYTVGTAASSAPQMVTSIVAAMASPITFGLSMAVPAAIYTGSVWNNQKEDNKSATAAIISGITQATLDKVGVTGLGKAAGLNITTKATQDMVLKELIEKGISREAAEKMVVKATQESVKEVSDAMKMIAIKRELSLRGVGEAAVKGVIAEGPTEGLQEIAGYLGENVGMPESQEEWNKLKNRTLNAAVGGAVLGGGIGAAGRGVAILTTPNIIPKEGSDLQFREEYKQRHGVDYVPDTQQLLGRAEKEVGMTNTIPSLDKLAEIETSKRAMEGIGSKLGSWVKDKGLSSLFGKWSSTIMRGKDYADDSLATLSTLLGASRAVNGLSIDDHQKLLEANIFKNFGNKEEMLGAFQGKDTNEVSQLLSKSNVVQAISRLINNKKLTGAKHINESNINIDSILGADVKDKAGIIEYANRIDNLLKAYNSATGSDISVESFLENKPLDKTIVSKNLDKFIEDIKNTFNIDGVEAMQIAKTILNNNEINSVDDFVDELLNPEASKFKSKAEIEKILNSPENKGKFSAYTSNDVLDNAYSLAARGSFISTNKEFIGKDGIKLATLIQNALNKGSITQEEASFMAREIKDYLDMKQGNYHPITNEYARGALNLVNFLSTITSLPLAAISSTVEFAQVYRNLNTKQSLKATKSLLETSGKEFSALFRDIGNAVGISGISPVAHRKQLSEAGFLREGGIGNRNDILTGYFQKWNEGFFKITGLTSITAITRHAKLSIAADAINNWVETVRNLDGKYTLQQVTDAKEHLIRIGVDIDFMTSIDKDTSVNQQRVESNLQAGAYNLVNEAVVVPSALNRPKFYSDPYLKLITQFQGYTSAFTANILPRLITDLSRKGSADQQNAAATIAMMFALSLLALYLKDIIKYGESPPKWMKEGKEFQRVVNQMGILGTGQRIWDILSDITDNQYKSNSFGGRMVDQISSQSPQLAYLNKINDALSAPEGRGIEKGARLLPIFGTSPALAKYLQKELGE